MFRPQNPKTGRKKPGENEPTDVWPLPDNPDFSKDQFHVAWDIINVGRSPAFLTRLVIKIEVVEWNGTPPKLPRETEFPNYILSPKIPPEDRHGSIVERPLTKTLYDDLKAGKSSIWVYGIAKYRDAFDKRHSTKFCCLWYVENGRAIYDPVGPKGYTKYT